MKAFMLLPSTRAALTALVLAYMALRSAQQLPEPKPGSDDLASPIIHQFMMIQAFLPERATIGYIGNSEPVRYTLAQTALAPRVVTRGSNYPYVLVDCPKDQRTAELLQGLEFVANQGDLAVYHRKAP